MPFSQSVFVDDGEPNLVKCKDDYKMEHVKSLILQVDEESSKKGKVPRQERRNSISLPIIAWEADPEPRPLPRYCESRKSFNLLVILNKNTTRNYDIFGSLKRRFLNYKR